MLWRIYFKKHWVSSTCWFRNWSLKLNLMGCISTTTLWVFFPQLSVSMHGFSFLVDMWQCFCYLKVRLCCQLIPGSYLEPWGWSHETFQWKKRRRKAWYWFTCDIAAQQRHRNNCSSCDAFTQSCNWLIQDSTILLLKNTMSEILAWHKQQHQVKHFSECIFLQKPVEWAVLSALLVCSYAFV